MLSSEDRAKFAEAMKVEIDGLQDILEVVWHQDIPDGVKPLPAVWAYDVLSFCLLVLSILHHRSCTSRVIQNRF
jgi:hypothetical protein